MTKKLFKIKRYNMQVFATRGRIFKTITKAKLDDTKEEDVHRWGNGWNLPQLFLNCKYRECQQRTYIVKEHYDWLKSSVSLSTLKKHVIFFPNTVLGCDGLRGGMKGSRCRLNIVMSISHRRWTTASGVFDLKHRWAEWSLCDIKVPQEWFESIWIRLLFYHSCGTLMSHSYNSAQRCFKSNKPIVYRPQPYMANAQEEVWGHSETTGAQRG